MAGYTGCVSQLDEFYVRGTADDVPAVEAALNSLTYDRGAIQVDVEDVDLYGEYGIAVDIETFRGIEAAPVVATFRDALKTAGWDTIDRTMASSLFKYPTLV